MAFRPAEPEVVSHSRFKEHTFQTFYNNAFSKFLGVHRVHMVDHLKTELAKSFTPETIKDFFDKANIPVVREMITESLLVNAWLQTQVGFSTGACGAISEAADHTVTLRFMISSFSSAQDLWQRQNDLETKLKKKLPGVQWQVSANRVISFSVTAEQFYDQKETVLSNFENLSKNKHANSVEGCRQYLLPIFQAYLTSHVEALRKAQQAADAIYPPCCIL